MCGELDKPHMRGAELLHYDRKTGADEEEEIRTLDTSLGQISERLAVATA
jgi:hypothetical protein